MIFEIMEVQNLNSVRKTKIIDRKNLTEAKRYATLYQFYQDTVLKIYDNNNNLLAYKKGKNWVNC